MNKNLRCARLLMVVASMAPLFFFWAFKGTKCISDKYFFLLCAALIAIPNLILLMRITISKKNKNTKKIKVYISKDQNDNLLLYLFAMLIPLITGDISTLRELLMMISVLLFLIFLFWHLNLFYLNIVFAFFGYKIFTVMPKLDSEDFVPFVLLTKRHWIKEGIEINTIRISDTVFIETYTE